MELNEVFMYSVSSIETTVKREHLRLTLLSSWLLLLLSFQANSPKI